MSKESTVFRGICRSLALVSILLLGGLETHAQQSCSRAYSDKIAPEEMSVVFHLMKTSPVSFTADPLADMDLPERMKEDLAATAEQLPRIAKKSSFYSYTREGESLKTGDTVTLGWVTPALPADSGTLAIIKKVMLKDHALVVFNSRSGRDLQGLPFHFQNEDPAVALLPGTKFKAKVSVKDGVRIIELTEPAR